MIMVNKYASLLALVLCCLTIQGGYSQGHYDEQQQQQQQQQGGLLRGGSDTVEAISGSNMNAFNSDSRDNWERIVKVQDDRDLQLISTRLYIFQCEFTFTGGSSVPNEEDFLEMLRRTQIFYIRQVGSNFGQNFRSVETSIDTTQGDFFSTTETEYFIQFTTEVVIKELTGVATPSQGTIQSLLLNWDRNLYLTNYVDTILATNVGVTITALSTLAPTVSAMPSTSIAPSLAPTISPKPTDSPSMSPSESTEAPSASPSMMPTVRVTDSPTTAPTNSPSEAPRATTTVNGVIFEFIDDNDPPTFNAMNADTDEAQDRIERAYNARFPDQYLNSYVDDSITLVRTSLSIPTEMNSITLTYSVTATFRTSGNVPTAADMSIDMRNFGQQFYDDLKDDIASRNTWGGIDRMVTSFP